MDTKQTKHLGLPENDQMIANSTETYISKTKTCKCTICGKTSIKYNRRRIINHVTAKRNIRKSQLQKSQMRARRKLNDRIIQMESDYGNIKVRHGAIPNSNET